MSVTRNCLYCGQPIVIERVEKYQRRVLACCCGTCTTLATIGIGGCSCEAGVGLDQVFDLTEDVA